MLFGFIYTHGGSLATSKGNTCVMIQTPESTWLLCSILNCLLRLEQWLYGELQSDRSFACQDIWTLLGKQ